MATTNKNSVSGLKRERESEYLVDFKYDINKYKRRWSLRETKCEYVRESGLCVLHRDIK